MGMFINLERCTQFCVYMCTAVHLTLVSITYEITCIAYVHYHHPYLQKRPYVRVHEEEVSDKVFAVWHCIY